MDMTSPVKLAVSGGLGAGKTVLCNKLATEHGYNVFSFSSEIDRELCTALSLPQGSMKATKDKVVVRKLMQAWGQYRRDSWVDYWPNRVASSIAAESGAGVNGFVMTADTRAVVDSVRAPNEVEFFTSLGFIHVHIGVSYQRQFEYLTRIQGMEQDEAFEVLNDPSEHWLDDYDTDGCIDLEVPTFEHRPDLVDNAVYAQLVGALERLGVTL